MFKKSSRIIFSGRVINVTTYKELYMYLQAYRKKRMNTSVPWR
jgi:hypothetical protein